MSCCTGTTEEHDPNEKEQAENWTDGTIMSKPRGCTDCLFLILLVACWLAMTLLGFCAVGWIDSDRIRVGNPSRLLHATDYAGNICGVDAAVKDLPDAYYMYTGSVVCVNGCPEEVNCHIICSNFLIRSIDMHAHSYLLLLICFSLSHSMLTIFKLRMTQMFSTANMIYKAP